MITGFRAFLDVHPSLQAKCLRPGQAGRRDREEMVPGCAVSRTVTSLSSNFLLSEVGQDPRQGGGWCPAPAMGQGELGLKPLPPPAPARRVPQPGGPGGAPRGDCTQPLLLARHGPPEPRLRGAGLWAREQASPDTPAPWPCQVRGRTAGPGLGGRAPHQQAWPPPGPWASAGHSALLPPPWSVPSSHSAPWTSLPSRH